MININTLNGQFYYELFYFLAILIAGVSFLYSGYKKGYAMSAWSLIFASGLIFLIIGTKLLTYNSNDWKEFFLHGTLPYTEKNTILGGILFGTFGLLLAKKVLRFNVPLLDELAVSFPLAMGIQRLGCLMVGCCYGTTTNLPWSVSYCKGTAVYYQQINEGVIGSEAVASISLHPSQLYQTIFCLLIAIVIHFAKNHFRRSGNLFLASVSLYLVSRFIIEFWRDTYSNSWAGEKILGLKLVQLFCLSGSIILMLIILLRKHKKDPPTQKQENYKEPYIYFVLLSLFSFSLAWWFTKVEFYFVLLTLLPTGLYYLKLLFNSQNSNSFKWYFAALLPVVLFTGILTAQQTYKELTAEKGSRNSFNDIRIGYVNYMYSHYHQPPKIEQGCLGTSTIPQGSSYVHSANGIGVSLDHIETFGKFQKFTARIETTHGWDTERNTDPVIKNYIGNVGVGLKHDFRWLGVGFGFYTGRGMPESKWNSVLYTTTSKPQLNSGITGSVRLFPYDIFYLEGAYNKYFPMVTTHRSENAFRITTGTGMGLKNGSCIELGYDFNGGLFAGSKVIIKNRFGLESYYYIPTNQYNVQMFQFSLIYRMNKPIIKRSFLKN